MADHTDPFSSSVIPFQLPEQVRAFAEKGVTQAREGYAKLKDAAETHNSTVEAVFNTATKGATEVSSTLLDIAKTNTNAGFDFAQSLIGVTSPAQAMELWSGFAKSQFEAFTGQSKQLAELSQKIAAETAEPIKTGANKLFQPAA
ncbi:phasin [Tardiphaga alba]|uniref:Phasin n=1 Tax=Tardiphaga alba TaxID=340268 RepID=A0ABX8ADG9_9BRAD|nr:phasin [Tardiphaga alba]QUS41567.1 phasin [Tardiphaga alba]